MVTNRSPLKSTYSLTNVSIFLKSMMDWESINVGLKWEEFGLNTESNSTAIHR